MINAMSVKCLGCTTETCPGPSLQRNAPLQLPAETHAKDNALPPAHKECEYPKGGFVAECFQFDIHSKSQDKGLSFYEDFSDKHLCLPLLCLVFSPL